MINSHRLVDRGLTLRLFNQRQFAVAVHGSHSHTRYGTGWIAKNEQGNWIDAAGVIPSDWQPDPKLLGETA